MLDQFLLLVNVWLDGAKAEPVLPSTATIADVIAENHVVFLH